MKTLPLLVTVAAGLLTVSGLQAQTDQVTTTARRSRSRVAATASVNSRSSTRLEAQRRAAQRAAVGTTVAPARIDGSVVRAARSGNPLQMVNPAAPAEYGDGRDVTRHEVDDPYQRPQGLKLFAVEF